MEQRVLQQKVQCISFLVLLEGSSKNKLANFLKIPVRIGAAHFLKKKKRGGNYSLQSGKEPHTKFTLPFSTFTVK